MRRGGGCAFRRSAPLAPRRMFPGCGSNARERDQPAPRTGRGRCRHAASEVAPRRANIFNDDGMPMQVPAPQQGRSRRNRGIPSRLASLSSDTPLRSSPRPRPARRLPSACRARAGGRIRAPRPSRPACRCRCDGRGLPASGRRCARGSLICAQISASVLPSHAISRGARCHSGWPGTRPGSKLACWWQIGQRMAARP